MFRLCLCTALCGITAIVAHAEGEDHALTTAYDRLRGGLQEELQILSAISDNATAKAAVGPLSKTLALLAQRVEGVSDKELCACFCGTIRDECRMVATCGWSSAIGIRGTQKRHSTAADDVPFL